MDQSSDEAHRRRCIHEAGHAVMAHLFSARIRRVFVLRAPVSTERTQDQSALAAGAVDTEDDASTRTIREMMLFRWAGSAAESLFLGGYTKGNADDDEWSRQLCGLLGLPYVPGGVLREAMLLLAPQRRAIQAMATELYARGELSGEEAHQIIARHLPDGAQRGPAPPKPPPDSGAVARPLNRAERRRRDREK